MHTHAGRIHSNKRGLTDAPRCLRLCCDSTGPLLTAGQCLVSDCLWSLSHVCSPVLGGLSMCGFIQFSPQPYRAGRVLSALQMMTGVQRKSHLPEIVHSDALQCNPKALQPGRKPIQPLPPALSVSSPSPRSGGGGLLWLKRDGHIPRMGFRTAHQMGLLSYFSGLLVVTGRQILSAVC